MSFPQSLAPLCSHTPPPSHPRPLCYRTHTRTHAHTHASTHTRTHVPTLPRCFHLHVPSSSQLPRVPKRTNASKHPLPKSHPLLFFLTCVVFVSPQPKLSKNVVYKFLPSPHVPTHQVRKHSTHTVLCSKIRIYVKNPYIFIYFYLFIFLCSMVQTTERVSVRITAIDDLSLKSLQALELPVIFMTGRPYH